MPDLISRTASDNFRLARSKTLVSLVDGTYNIIQIPRYSFVSGIWLIVTTAYTGGSGGSATIGFTGNGESADADGFMDAAACGARATGTKVMWDDGQPGSKGKWFSAASGMLTITLDDDSDTTLMIGTVFMQYSIIY